MKHPGCDRCRHLGGIGRYQLFYCYDGEYHAADQLDKIVIVSDMDQTHRMGSYSYNPEDRARHNSSLNTARIQAVKLAAAAGHIDKRQADRSTA